MCISKRQKRKWRRTLSWPWFSHWALRKPPARNSHKSESLKAFQTQLLWRLGAQISPDKSHPWTAFLLHSNKFTFSPTSRHSHPHSPCSLKMCSKPKFIFSWNSGKTVHLSASHVRKSSDNRPVYWRRDKDIWCYQPYSAITDFFLIMTGINPLCHQQRVYPGPEGPRKIPKIAIALIIWSNLLWTDVRVIQQVFLDILAAVSSWFIAHGWLYH